MHADIKEVLFNRDDIAGIVKRIASEISEDYKEKDVLLVGILKGSVVFMADLMRAIETKCNIDFMAVSSYGASSKSSGVVKILKDLDLSVEGKDILIVEDILDSGITLNYLKDLFIRRGVNSLKICTILNKPDRRKAPIYADYVGFDIPDEFVVGYGLDYAEKYRNLPFVGILKREVYENN